MNCDNISNLKEWQAAMSALTKRGKELMDGPEAASDDEDVMDDDAPDAMPPNVTNANTAAPKAKGKAAPKDDDEDEDNDDY